jgi:hypothetical protein
MTAYQKSCHNQTTVYHIVAWTMMGYGRYGNTYTEKSVVFQWTRKLSSTSSKERGEKAFEPITTE